MNASVTPPRTSRRPSLVAGGSTTGNSSEIDDDQGFSVSILSAAGASEHPTRRQRHQSGHKGRQVAWWLGVIIISLALLVVARWKPQREDASQGAVALLRVAPTSAPTVPASSPDPATVTATGAVAPTSDGAPALAMSLYAGETRPALPSAASSAAVPRDAPKKLVETASARRKVAPATSAVKPAPRASAHSSAPKSPATRDHDAELVAALMANADAGREFQLPQATQAPLTRVERKRLADEMNKCSQRHAAADACRARACRTLGYAGRAKSCPATVVAPTNTRPAHSQSRPTA